MEGCGSRSRLPAPPSPSLHADEHRYKEEASIMSAFTTDAEWERSEDEEELEKESGAWEGEE